MHLTRHIFFSILALKNGDYMNFSIFLHFPFLSLYIEFDNKYIIFSSVFLFYKNDRDFTPCRHVAYAYIISSFTISLAHALTLFILFVHSKAFSSFRRSVMPCVCFMPSMSR